ncbi:hypothetical protein BV378_15385 [Nostoc sp. RF31YmG]|nr:hypothetical protein BV378_15385 [Nostoc sp. RF31YmG]
MSNKPTSPEDIKRLVSRIKSGELKIVAGFPVEDVEIVSESSNDDESIKSDDKWRLVQKIVNPVFKIKDLLNADLSDADLNNANVVDALFGNNAGLTEEMILDLSQRGAIFGDRPPVLNPR